MAKSPSKNDLIELFRRTTSFSNRPVEVRLNPDWLKEQIKEGSIRKEDYNPGATNYFTGIPVEITDDVHSFEVSYKEDERH